MPPSNCFHSNNLKLHGSFCHLVVILVSFVLQLASHTSCINYIVSYDAYIQLVHNV